jgi:broad specificity phosphatase PhoE
MAAMEAIYLVRHGQTHWNAEARMQGWLDSPLTEAGRRQAEAHAELLVRESVDCLWASPLGRTRETAAIINARLRVPLSHDPRLRERNCGAWEGLTADEVERRWPGEIAVRGRDPFLHRPPGGENLADVVHRVEGLLDQLLALPVRRLGIVSHGIMGRALLTRLLALEPEHVNAARQPNDVVYRIAFTDGARRVAHFRAGAGPTDGLYTVRGVESVDIAAGQSRQSRHPAPCSTRGGG